ARPPPSGSTGPRWSSGRTPEVSGRCTVARAARDLGRGATAAHRPVRRTGIRRVVVSRTEGCRAAATQFRPIHEVEEHGHGGRSAEWLPFPRPPPYREPARRRVWCDHTRVDAPDGARVDASRTDLP